MIYSNIFALTIQCVCVNVSAVSKQTNHLLVDFLSLNRNELKMVLDGRADDLDLKAQAMRVSMLLTLHEATVVLGPSPSDSPTTEYALTVTCRQRDTQ